MQSRAEVLELAISCWAKDVPTGHPTASLRALRAWIALESVWGAQPNVAELLVDLRDRSYDLSDHPLLLGDLLGALGDTFIGDGWGPIPSLVNCVVARGSTRILDCSSLVRPEDASMHAVERILSRLMYCAWRFNGSPAELFDLMGIRIEEWPLLAGAWDECQIRHPSLKPCRAAIELELGGTHPSSEFDPERSDEAIRNLATSVGAQSLRALLLRISRNDQPADHWLRTYYGVNPNDADAALALGTYLAMSDRWDEAFTFLDRADNLSGGGDEFARVMYVAAARALRVSPARGLDEMLQSRLDGWTDPFNPDPDDVVNLHLMAWAALGKGEEPAILHADLVKELDEFKHALTHTVETSIAALGHDLRAKSTRDEFLFGAISELLPRPSRDRSEEALRARIKRWNKLPDKAKRWATTAYYLWNDSALDEIPAVEAALAALRGSVEFTLRHTLGITGRAEMKVMIETLENRAPTDAALLDSVRRLATLGNRSVHHDVPSFARDLDAAWDIVLGDGTSAGCLDRLLEYAQQRR